MQVLDGRPAAPGFYYLAQMPRRNVQQPGIRAHLVQLAKVLLNTRLVGAEQPLVGRQLIARKLLCVKPAQVCEQYGAEAITLNVNGSTRSLVNVV